MTAPNVLLLLPTFVLMLAALPPNIDLAASLVFVVTTPKLNEGFAMVVAAVGAVVAAPNILVDGVLLPLIAPAVDAPKLNPPTGPLLAALVEDIGVDLLALLPPNAKGVVVTVVVVAPKVGFDDTALLVAPNVGVALWAAAAPKVNAPC